MRSSEVLAATADAALAAARRDARWGWVPLVVGCAVITAGVFAVIELAIAHASSAADANTLRLVRAGALAASIAAWSVWYVARARTRVERLQADLHARQAELTEHVWRAEQLAGLGALSRMVAHDVRTPLNSLALQAQLIARAVRGLEGPAAGQIRDALAAIGADNRRIAQLVDEYVSYAGTSSVAGGADRVSVTDLVFAAIEAQRATAEDRGVALQTAVDPASPVVRGDRAELQRAVSVLTRSAIALVRPGGRVEIAAGRDAASQRATVSVTADAEPFPEPDAVFRPFYPARSPAAGFGLAIVRDIVRAHGGEVTASNDRGSRPRVTIRLPVEE